MSVKYKAIPKRLRWQPRRCGCRSSQHRPRPPRRCTAAAPAPPQTGWQRLCTGLAADLEASAREHGALQRARKVRDAWTLLRLVLLYALSGRSARTMAGAAIALCLVQFSDPALLKRVKRSRAWLKHLVTIQLLRQARFAGPLCAELMVTLCDATVITKCGSKGVDWRVHLRLDLARESIVDVEVTDRKGGETLKRLAWRPGELAVGDRGYAHRGGLWAVLKAGAHFLVRLNAQNVPLLDGQGKGVDLVAVAQQAEVGRPVEKAVWVKDDPAGGVLAFPARLVMVRRHPEAAERERRKVRGESTRKKRTPSQQTLQAAEFLFLLTSVNADILPTAAVAELYRLRWQIEIAFKRLKSLLDLDVLQARSDELGEAVLWAKLLMAVVLQEFQSEWETSFLAEVPPLEGTMMPRWRMQQALWAGIKAAVGVFPGVETWLAAGKEAWRRLRDPPRQRTRDRNARWQATFAQLAQPPLS